MGISCKKSGPKLAVGKVEVLRLGEMVAAGFKGRKMKQASFGGNLLLFFLFGPNFLTLWLERRRRRRASITDRTYTSPCLTETSYSCLVP